MFSERFSYTLERMRRFRVARRMEERSPTAEEVAMRRDSEKFLVREGHVKRVGGELIIYQFAPFLLREFDEQHNPVPDGVYLSGKILVLASNPNPSEAERIDIRLILKKGHIDRYLALGRDGKAFVYSQEDKSFRQRLPQAGIDWWKNIVDGLQKPNKAESGWRALR